MKKQIIFSMLIVLTLITLVWIIILLNNYFSSSVNLELSLSSINDSEISELVPSLSTAELTPETPYKVLVINSYHDGYEWSDSIMAGIISVFEDSNVNAELFIEYMDTKRYAPEKVFSGIATLYAKNTKT